MRVKIYRSSKFVEVSTLLIDAECIGIIPKIREKLIRGLAIGTASYLSKTKVGNVSIVKITWLGTIFSLSVGSRVRLRVQKDTCTEEYLFETLTCK